MLKLGVVMDPIESIKVQKDTTYGLLLEAQQRQFEIYYIQQKDLFTREGTPYALMQRMDILSPPGPHFKLHHAPTPMALSSLDVLLMRKDPPFDMHYIYTTYILEKAQQLGVKVLNDPRAIRDANEKMFIQWFPECCTDTLVASNFELIEAFWKEHGDIVIKPLNGMGGEDVFRILATDPNLHEIYLRISQQAQVPIMAQTFLPEIYQGDKRILMINGTPVPYALARMPAKGEFRANLAVGGHGVGVELTERDRWIAAQVGPTLKEKGLFFVGLDVIGEYLTEINVTSPTCMREIERDFKINIAALFFDALALSFKLN